MIEGYLTVSKEEAKKMIDAAPGDSVSEDCSDALIDGYKIMIYYTQKNH